MSEQFEINCKNQAAFSRLQQDFEAKRLSELAKKDIEKSCFISFNQNHGGNKMAGTESEWDKVREKLWENGEDFIVMDNKPKEGLTTASQDLMEEIICDMTTLSAKMELLIDLVNSK